MIKPLENEVYSSIICLKGIAVLKIIDPPSNKVRIVDISRSLSNFESQNVLVESFHVKEIYSRFYP